jgi:hypothetical protein
LEQAVAKEREKYQLSTQAMSSGLSAIPVMAINDTVMIATSLVVKKLLAILNFSRFLCLLMTQLTLCRLSCRVQLKTFWFSLMLWRWRC